MSLKRLLNLIVHIVARAVRLDHCDIFLYHKTSDQYILKASQRNDTFPENLRILASDSPLITYLKAVKEPLMYEEIKQYHNHHWKKL